jgi:hypothetical protein
MDCRGTVKVFKARQVFSGSTSCGRALEDQVVAWVLLRAWGSVPLPRIWFRQKRVVEM